jgi:hypothetical protein
MMLKELFKPKDNYLKALERLYIPLEKILENKNIKFIPKKNL